MDSRGVRKQKKDNSERVSDRETVKQNDSAGLLFESLPACQFRCNIFIDTRLATTWQAGRSSTFYVPHQKFGVSETGSLSKLWRKSFLFLFRCLSLREVCKTGNVYSLDLEKALGICTHILNSQVIFDFIAELCTVWGGAVYCLSYLLHDLLLV